MKEIFKVIQINGENTHYMISNLGRCINVKTEKILKPQEKIYKNKALKQFPDSVYMQYYLYHNKKYYYLLAHRLVAIAFIDIPKKYLDQGLSYNDLEVDHINNKRYDNRAQNLQWLTKQENYEKMLKSGNRRYAKCEDHGNTLLTNDQIFKVCDLLQENKLTQKQISFITDVPYKTVNKIYKKKDFTYISSSYDFSKYNKFEKIFLSDDLIIEALELVSTGKYTLHEVSKKVGINNSTLKSIVQGRSRKDLRDKFDLSKFYNR